MTYLRRVDPAFPHLRVIADDPAIAEHHDALYIPFASHELDNDPAYGLYDQSGHRLAPYARGPASTPVGGAPHIAWPAEIDDAPDDTYVYAGPLIMHYGHFLLATLSRFWPFTAPGPWPRFILHAHNDPADMPPFARAAFDALGLGPDRFVRFTRPTRLRHIIVPDPAFEEQHFVHDAYRELCRHIGQDSGGQDPPSRPGPPAYLARTRLGFGVKKLANEDAVIDALARLGVEILHPETMPFADQVALFASDRVILGLGGSGFHTSIFAPPRSRMVTINLALMDNQVLIDRVNANWALYLQPTITLPPEARGDGILATYTFTDPNAVAVDLLRAAQRAN